MLKIVDMIDNTTINEEEMIENKTVVNILVTTGPFTRHILRAKNTIFWTTFGCVKIYFTRHILRAKILSFENFCVQIYIGQPYTLQFSALYPEYVHLT